MDCQFVEQDGKFVCSVCGWTWKTPMRRNCGKPVAAVVPGIDATLRPLVEQKVLPKLKKLSCCGHKKKKPAE